MYNLKNGAAQESEPYSRFDGTDRTPREAQKIALDWLARNFDRSDALCIVAPTGTGKAAIARAIQLENPRANIVNPNNVLVWQMLETYVDVNFLIGRKHYSCHQGGSCDARPKGKPPCLACPYEVRKKRALRGDDTFFNAHSLYYLKRHPDYVERDVTVLDEAHMTLQSLREFGSSHLPQDAFGFTDADVKNDFAFTAWAKAKMTELQARYDGAVECDDLTEQIKAQLLLRTLGRVLLGFLERPSNYAYWLQKQKNAKGVTETVLTMQAIKAPAWACREITGSGKVVLMSATLFPTDIEELLGHANYLKLELPSPIPKENRRVFFRPAGPMNRDTDPLEIVRQCEAVLARYPDPTNAIIHVTYGLAVRMKGLFSRPVISHTGEDKQQKLELWKRKGGVFLASGFAEGVDLKDDLCRVNIIPKLLYPDLSSPIVRKRRDSLGGESWYNQSVIKTTIQQAGRSTRAEDDFSDTYILDPRFDTLVKWNRKFIPQSFLEAIVWRSG